MPHLRKKPQRSKQEKAQLRSSMWKSVRSNVGAHAAGKHAGSSDPLSGSASSFESKSGVHVRGKGVGTHRSSRPDMGKNAQGFSMRHAKDSSFAVGAGNAHEHRKGPTFTRRDVLIGAGALAGVTALGGAGMALSNASNKEDLLFTPISVADDAVTNLDALKEAKSPLKLVRSVHLQPGSLVFCNTDSVAACLVPSGISKPLMRIALLYLQSGSVPTIISKPRGLDEGYEILDVRASGDGIVWVESNVFEGGWRIYTAQVSNADARKITKVDEGTNDQLIPSIGIAGPNAFWQVMPNPETSKNSPSEVRMATLGSSDHKTVYTSKSPFATRMTSINDGVVIAPRAESSRTHYQLTKLSGENGSVVAQMALPSSMAPDLASFGPTGFSFCFTNIYNYGGGISNLGTYVPRTRIKPGQEEHGEWFRFGRAPQANPSWIGAYSVFKSTRSLAAVDLEHLTYALIEQPDHTSDFGEYLASSGTLNTVVGFSQITQPKEANLVTNIEGTTITHKIPKKETATADSHTISASNLVKADDDQTLVRIFKLKH